jgi:hypothetical protein
MDAMALLAGQPSQPQFLKGERPFLQRLLGLHKACQPASKGFQADEVGL